MKSGPKISAIALVVLELLICLIIYFVCLYIRRSRSRDPVSDSGSELTRPKLEPIIVFFPYSMVKELCHQLQGSLQCASCRIHFAEGDEETVRLISKCGHVFHSKCVNPWAVACPCCRAGLGPNVRPDECDKESEDVVVVEIEGCMIKLPDEILKQITTDGNLVQPKMEFEPCPKT